VVKMFWTERDFLWNVAVLLLRYLSFVLFVFLVPFNIFHLMRFLFMPLSRLRSCLAATHIPTLTGAT
jgi:hypothetical protein